jgi:hypothetical protein
MVDFRRLWDEPELPPEPAETVPGAFSPKALEYVLRGLRDRKS